MACYPPRMNWDAKQLNRMALAEADSIAARESALRVTVSKLPNGIRLIDCGVSALGGLEAGLALSRVCTSGLATIRITGGSIGSHQMPQIEVSTDHPKAACLLSQYAGWQVADDGYFGMGSGPMRMAACREPMLKEFGFGPTPVEHAVGVLEAGQLPPAGAMQDLAEKCGGKLTALVAPTASQAGNVQILSRSVETAMHKLHEVQFDTNKVVSGFGTVPVPPVAADDLTGIGRTNDSILYGARVNLWVRCEDDEIAEVGPKVPSNSSPAHGRPFLDLFKEAKGDFYAIDKHLFSPAVVVFQNLNTGRSFRFGEVVENLAIARQA